MGPEIAVPVFILGVPRKSPGLPTPGAAERVLQHVEGSTESEPCKEVIGVGAALAGD